MNYITSKVFWEGVGLSCGPSQIVGVCGLVYSVPPLVYHVHKYIQAKNAFENMLPDNALFPECEAQYHHHSGKMNKYWGYTRTALKALAPFGGAIWVAATETGPDGAFPRQTKRTEETDSDNTRLIAQPVPGNTTALRQRKTVQFAIK